MSEEEKGEGVPDPAAEAEAVFANPGGVETTNSAIVQGAPETEDEQRDPAAYQLSLPAFHGPLDLLLHLIKKHEVDIYDIPILLITDQYNAYLDTMTELHLDVAADYIYMASLLINIKSRMLLPRDEVEGEQSEDHAKSWSTAARVPALQSGGGIVRGARAAHGHVVAAASSLAGRRGRRIDMSDVGLFDLIDAFRTALVRYRRIIRSRSSCSAPSTKCRTRCASSTRRCRRNRRSACSGFSKGAIATS